MRISLTTMKKGRHRQPGCQRPRLSVECLEARYLLSAGYAVTNLVSDIPGLADQIDTNLVNPWGFAETPQGQFRVSANGTGESLLLNARGNVLGKPVIIPTPSDSPVGTVATPDGSALNTTSDFVISHGGQSAPATFLISTEDGTIAGFNPKVDKHEGVIALHSPTAIASVSFAAIFATAAATEASSASFACSSRSFILGPANKVVSLLL